MFKVVPKLPPGILISKDLTFAPGQVKLFFTLSSDNSVNSLGVNFYNIPFYVYGPDSAYYQSTAVASVSVVFGIDINNMCRIF